MASAYIEFVKKHIKSSALAGMKQTEKMKKIGLMWREHKGK